MPAMDQKEISEAEKIAREDRHRARVMKDFVNSEGWRLLSELIQNKQQSYASELLQEPTAGNMPSPNRDYWVKGAMYGLAYILDLPRVIVAATDVTSPSGEPEE